jgi:hypothetical protein
MASTTAFLAAPAFLRHGVLHFPVAHMRGGTSTGVVLWGPHLAPFGDLRDEIIRKIMGVPDAGEARGNKQITGLGRGPSTSNKVGDWSVLWPLALQGRLRRCSDLFHGGCFISCLLISGAR